jgi:aminoglycoside 2'-N-acetyltransferase I
LRTAELTPADLEAIRRLLTAAFGDDPGEAFENSDWEHALGGVHVVLDVDREIAAHASVVERELHVEGQVLRTGYVEAVATLPALQGRGFGTLVMREVNGLIAERYELGALGTGSHHFYERLGWRTWRGPSSVRLPDGRVERTPDEDGYILVLETPATPGPFDLTAAISCEWRPGDVW